MSSKRLSNLQLDLRLLRRLSAVVLIAIVMGMAVISTADVKAQTYSCTGWCVAPYYDEPQPSGSCPDADYNPESGYTNCSADGGCSGETLGTWYDGGCADNEEPTNVYCTDYTSWEPTGVYMLYCEVVEGEAASCPCGYVTLWDQLPAEPVSNCFTEGCIGG